MRNLKFTWSGPLGISAVSIALVAGVLLVKSWGFLSALVWPAAEDPSKTGIDGKLLAMHTEQIDRFRDRVDGRSPFHLPDAWPPEPPRLKPPTPPPPPDKTRDDTGPKGPPAEYSGPTVAYIVGTRVFFEEMAPSTDSPYHNWLEVGEERDGVKVLAVNAPWDLRLQHEGGEYDIKLHKTGLPEGTAGWKPGSSIESVISDSSPSSGRISAPPVEERTADAEGAHPPDEPARGGRGPSAPKPGGSRPPADHNGNAQASIPKPLTKQEVEKMSRPEALEALQEYTKAKMNRSLDEKTKAQLQADWDLLMERIKKTNKNGSR